MMETLLPNFLLPHRTHQAKPMQIRVPTMLVWGRNDKALSASMAFLSAKYVLLFFIKTIITYQLLK